MPAAVVSFLYQERALTRPVVMARQGKKILSLPIQERIVANLVDSLPVLFFYFLITEFGESPWFDSNLCHSQKSIVFSLLSQVYILQRKKIRVIQKAYSEKE